MNTKLLYLEYMDQLTTDAVVVDIITGEKNTIILDQTVFYPQGGGQPYDTGYIQKDDGTRFRVDEARFIDGAVHHIGRFENGSFIAGDTVRCVVDAERRLLHARLHSGGHVVDMGIDRLGLLWIPGKGYHFPDGPYVEYIGDLAGRDTEHLRVELEEMCNKIIAEQIETHVVFMEKGEMATVCRHVPENLPANKPGRVVLYGNFGVPCGGTHVANLSQIGTLKIRKIKQTKQTIKVSYEVIL